MKKVFLFIFASLSSFYLSYAQQNLDSAYNRINDRDYEGAIQICQNLIATSEDKSVIAEAYFAIAFCHEDLHEPTEALSNYYQALVFKRDSIFVAGIYNNLASIYFNVALYEESVKLFDLALKYEQRADRIGRNLINRCMAKSRLEKYDLALADAYLALTISDSLKVLAKRNKLKYRTYNQIGLIKLDRSEFSEAISNFNKANDLDFSRKSYVNLGLVHEKKRETEQAIEHYKKAINSTERTNTKFRAFHYLGELLLAESRFLSAGQPLSEATVLFDSLSPTHELDDISVFQSFGNYHKLIGETEKAFVLYDKTIDLHKEFNKRQQAISEKFGQLAILSAEENVQVKAKSEEQESNDLAMNITITIISMVTIAFLLWRLRNMKKAKQLVEKEKQLLQTKIDDFLSPYGM
mgnify:CR=1 FL=1